MAKKEKQIKEEVTAKNNVRSTGNVKVTIYNGDKKVKTINHHNTGTQDLCKFLSKALVGYNTTFERPNFIIPCKLKSGQLDNIFNFGVPADGYTEPKNSGDTAAESSLIFDIPGSALSSGTEIAGFRLYSNDFSSSKKVLFAEVKLKEEDYIISQSNTSIRVEWTMKVSYI